MPCGTITALKIRCEYTIFRQTLLLGFCGLNNHKKQRDLGWFFMCWLVMLPRSSDRCGARFRPEKIFFLALNAFWLAWPQLVMGNEITFAEQIAGPLAPFTEDGFEVNPFAGTPHISSDGKPGPSLQIDDHLPDVVRIVQRGKERFEFKGTDLHGVPGDKVVVEGYLRGEMIHSKILELPQIPLPPWESPIDELRFSAVSAQQNIFVDNIRVTPVSDGPLIPGAMVPQWATFVVAAVAAVLAVIYLQRRGQQVKIK